MVVVLLELAGSDGVAVGVAVAFPGGVFLACVHVRVGAMAVAAAVAHAPVADAGGVGACVHVRVGETVVAATSCRDVAIAVARDRCRPRCGSCWCCR
jgi:hypothetical protein